MTGYFQYPFLKNTDRQGKIIKVKLHSNSEVDCAAFVELA